MAGNDMTEEELEALVEAENRADLALIERRQEERATLFDVLVLGCNDVCGVAVGVGPHNRGSDRERKEAPNDWLLS